MSTDIDTHDWRRCRCDDCLDIAHDDHEQRLVDRHADEARDRSEAQR